MLDKLFFSMVTYGLLLASVAFGAENGEEPKSICFPTECYTVIDKLGEGYFGKVYAVEDTQGRRYAMKTYKSGRDHDEFVRVLSDVEREFRLGQQLNHPNIVKSVDFHIDESNSSETTAYLLLELLTGKTVWHTERETVGRVQSLEMGVQLADAVEYALSDHDLIYLDLHANNVMITDEGDLVVIDVASFVSRDEYIAFDEYRDPTTPDQEASEETVALYSMMDEVKSARESAREILRSKYSHDYEIPESELKEEMFRAIMPYFFDRVTEMCVRLIEKAPYERAEKLELRSTLKMQSWNFQYDKEDNVEGEIQQYFDTLMDELELRAAQEEGRLAA